MNMSDSLSTITKSKIEVLNGLIAENDKVTMELNKLKILSCALKNVVRNGIPGNPKLTEKLRQLIGAEEVVALCQNMPLLGLEVENLAVTLSDTERKEIKPLLENEIKTLHLKILQYDLRTECAPNDSAELAGVKLKPSEPSEKMVQRMSYKLDKWNEMLLYMRTVINELQHIRQEIKLFGQKDISCLKLSCEKLELEAKSLALQIEKQIHNENEYVIPAMKRLSLSVDEEYCNGMQELEDLKQRKEAYEKLKGTEYEEVLHEYIKMKKDIEIKRWALEKLENVGL